MKGFLSLRSLTVKTVFIQSDLSGQVSQVIFKRLIINRRGVYDRGPTVRGNNYEVNK